MSEANSLEITGRTIGDNRYDHLYPQEREKIDDKMGQLDELTRQLALKAEKAVNSLYSSGKMRQLASGAIELESLLGQMVSEVLQNASTQELLLDLRGFSDVIQRASEVGYTEKVMPGHAANPNY